MAFEEKKVECRGIWAKVCADNYLRLRSYAWRLTHNSHAAEDLVQDTITKILRLVPDPEAVEDKLSYLLRSVHNTWLRWLKEKGRPEIISIDDPANKAVFAIAAPQRDDDAAEAESRRRMMLTQMRRLNERERGLLTLYLEGYKAGEIAAQLDEDVRVISYELNALRTKVRYRLRDYLNREKRNR